ncbi:MAG: right-handed parallel beta-helix repeat-containing protein [Gammaproteobacteria bacterium]|nr:right-handed parallel beta-helix repeat-containing protein [Gammaproteobacteria bacterium]
MKFLRVLLSLLKSYLISIGLFVNLLVLGAILYYGVDTGAQRAGQVLGALAKHLSGGKAAAHLPGTRAGADLKRGLPADAFAYREHDVPLEAWVGSGRVLHVGPDAEYKLPSKAARAAKEGDTILIAPGRYATDTAVWTADHLYIKGDGGLVSVDARGAAVAEGKAIWVTKSNHVRIENVEFMNAAVPDQNGAGIRAEGDYLHVVGCYFHDNESGLMSRNNADAEIVVDYSEFARNGSPNGQAHQIYAGTIAKLTVRGSFLHHAQIGSDLKSRAVENRVLYNRIMDGSDGRDNYSIDLSEGGRAFIVGNVIQQGATGENYHLIAFAPERAFGATHELYVVNNTLVNDRDDGVFIWNNTDATAWVYDNVFAGPGEIVRGPAVIAGNVITPAKRSALPWKGSGFDEETESRNRLVDQAGFRSRAEFDYTLVPGAAAADAAVDLPALEGESLVPEFEPRPPLGLTQRATDAKRDAGAFELAR